MEQSADGKYFLKDFVLVFGNLGACSPLHPPRYATAFFYFICSPRQFVQDYNSNQLGKLGIDRVMLKGI